MSRPFAPDWTLPPEPAGEDEAAVQLAFEREMEERGESPVWSALPEWMKEAWRREVRDT
jgi:hypothetical protein